MGIEEKSKRYDSRLIGGFITVISIGSVVLLYTCMQTGGMDVRIENESAEMYDNWLRMTCDVINEGDPGNVTIVGSVYQNGRKTDSCEEEIHLNRGQIREVALYPMVDPEAGEYTYEFEAINLEPD
jgi:hypothetical protein